MFSRRSQIALAVVVIVVAAGFVWWSFARGGDDPLVGERSPFQPGEPAPTPVEDPPFEDPVDEPTLEEDPGDPPPAEGELVDSERWPGVSDVAVSDADHAFELTGGGGRLLVLIDCAAAGVGQSIALSAVGLAPEVDIVALSAPDPGVRVGLMTDPQGNGFASIAVILDAEVYAMTFEALDGASITFPGCPQPDVDDA